PAVARAKDADAPPPAASATAPSARSKRMREDFTFASFRRGLRRVRVERIRRLLDGQRERERIVERLAAHRGREISSVLRLTRCDPAERTLETARLDPAQRPEVRAEDRLLELPRELDDRPLARERPSRIAEIDVLGHSRRETSPAQD